MGDYDAAKVTKEELDYLDLRRKLKEQYRKQLKQETYTSAPLEASTITKDDNFGSFFGPSQPNIVPRVIKDITSLLSHPRYGMKKVVNQSSGRLRPTSNVAHKVEDLKKLKLQKMKDARDYSFLFSDDAKPPLNKKVYAPTQTPERGGQLLKKKKPVSYNSKIQCPAPRYAEDDSTAITWNNHVASGHGNCNGAASKTGTMKKTVSVKVVAKQELTSANPQTSRPINKSITKPVSSRPSLQDRPEKRHLAQRHTENEDDGFDYRSAIRSMFRYNPDKYRDNDRDTSNMEAGFHDILKEERRSALIARKEDQIEQKKIKDEARKDRMRNDAKRRKLSQS